MPSVSAVPTMTASMMVVRWATNCSRPMRRGLSESGPNHHSVADAADPKAACAASSSAAWSSAISRSSLSNMSAMASVISRPSLRVRIVASEVPPDGA